MQLQATQTLLFRSSSNFVKHARYISLLVGFVRWSARKKKLYDNKIQKKAQQKKFPIDGYGIHNTARPYGPRFLIIISVGTSYCNFIYYLYSMRTQYWLVSMFYVVSKRWLMMSRLYGAMSSIFARYLPWKLITHDR